jgi:hypothetical protein
MGMKYGLAGAFTAIDTDVESGYGRIFFKDSFFEHDN